MTARDSQLLLLKLISASLLYCLQTSHASADMGRMVLSEQHGDTRISVFTSPEPLHAGPIDISVLLQHSETDQPIPDAEVNMRITSGEARSPAIHAVATQAAATNKLLRAALLELPHPGSWDVEITYIVDHKPARQLHFTIQAASQREPWFAVWPWFSWPVAVILLYGVHRRLTLRKRILAAA